MINYIYKYLNILLLRYDIMCYNYHVEVNKMSKEKKEVKDKNNNEKKKKKFKIKWGKILVWLALLAMVGSAIIAILSPVMYKN